MLKSNEKAIIYLKRIRPYHCAVLRKEVPPLSMFGNVLTLQTAHGNFLMLCPMVLLPNINLLISKQNKTPKIDPKMVKQ